MKSVSDSVLHHSKQCGTKIALADQKNCFTYEQLAERILLCADILAGYGIEKGKCLVAECTQDVWFFILKLACEVCNAVFVPVESGVTEERLIEVIQDMSAQIYVGYREINMEGVEEISPFSMVESIHERTILHNEIDYSLGYESSLDDIVEVLYSTGTTGKPKGISITNKNNIAIAHNVIYSVEMPADAVEMIPLPLSHSHALRSIYAHMVNGSTAIITDGINNIGMFFQLIEKYNANALDLSPAIFKILLAVAGKGIAEIADQMDYIQIGTSVLDEELKERLVGLFPHTRVYNSYGATEAGRSGILEIKEKAPMGCVGRATSHANFFIVDPKTHESISSDYANPGLIAVSGEMVCAGYWGNTISKNDNLKEGIYYTSDLGYIDESGRLIVLGRVDDVINYKGIKIMPEEIETIVRKYDGIADCACVPIADSMCGQVPKLFIQVRDKNTFEMDTFCDWLNKKTEKSRMPKYIELIDRIPRTYNGKLQRKKLIEGK